MSAEHRIELYEEGTLTGARVVCLGADDDECHQWCGEGCEEECTGYPWLPPDTPLVAQAPVVGHRAQLYNGCRIADWINGCGIEDTHVDDGAFPWDDDTDTQPDIRSGLIEVEWTGHDYVWNYPDEVPAGAVS